ncbi:MAG: hypothetical protein OXG64_08745, partial [Chloroflexi bacterium]|nr:hypothetical protein [Chloroflexota bacterium]
YRRSLYRNSTVGHSICPTVVSHNKPSPISHVISTVVRQNFSRYSNFFMQFRQATNLPFPGSPFAAAGHTESGFGIGWTNFPTLFRIPGPFQFVHAIPA